MTDKTKRKGFTYSTRVRARRDGGGVMPGEGAMTSNELFAAALRLRKINWCRARLLHAFAGAAKQGVLQEVLEELLDEDSGPEDGFEIHERIVRALKATGWLTDEEVMS